jgi:hypothetical protein
MLRKHTFSHLFHQLPITLNSRLAMKNTFQKYYIPLIITSTVLIFQSCTERMDDFKLKGTKTHCVIYGEITSDTTAQKVSVTRTADYFSNEAAEPISGATLTITDGTDTIPLTESVTELGSYYTDSSVYGVPGKIYTLNVSNVDLLGDGVMKSYTASAEMKPVSKIDSIDTEFISRWEFWAVKAWAKDPAESEDYYMFKAYINGVLNADSLLNLIVTEDKFYNGSTTNGITCYYFLEKDTIKPGYTVTLDICGITKDYFHFISEAQTMASPQNPMFSGPPANVRTNFNNDAVGYFAAYSVARCSRLYLDKK